MKHPLKSTLSEASYPGVLQIGFAGTRHLGMTKDQSEITVELLCRILRKLPKEMGLQASHNLCGISAIAIGGDFLFTEACGRLNIPQRIFLPQQRDEFLSAIEFGQPDFTATESSEALRLLALPHIVEERVVSSAGDRVDRFVETNREILRACNVVLCLVVDGLSPRPVRLSGTRGLLSMAEESRKPALELILDLTAVHPRIQESWHWPSRTL